MSAPVVLHEGWTENPDTLNPAYAFLTQSYTFNEKKVGQGISLKQLRQRAQMVFQDPYESLNPRSTIYEIVEEPLVVRKIGRTREKREAQIKTALEDAGLHVSIHAEILNLLRELRQKRDISIVFITHDLSTVAYFADRIAVMYLGRIVETGLTNEVLKSPQHPYAKALLSVVPVPNPRLRRERVILQGETPNAANIPSGCRFHPRCPVAIAECSVTDPAFVEFSETHKAACLNVQTFERSNV